MATYRDLFEKLGQMSQEQLDTEISFFPVGYTDAEAQTLLSWPLISQVVELSSAVQDLYYLKPSDEEGEEDNYIESGVMAFSESEVEELGIAEDADYTLVCRKGRPIFKIKDNAVFSEVASVGLDTSIMPNL